MRISSLTIEYSDGKNGEQKKIDFEDFYLKKEYKFFDRTLITSREHNSKGKTTLIRFILFALGFKVSLTDGMNIYKYKTKMEITYNGNIYFLKREENKCSIEVIEGNGKKVKKDVKENILMLDYILGINNLNMVNNLLGIFYIDQEKGWTLLNRGKVIGNNKFNIEDFLIAIVSKVELDELKNKIVFAESEIKKAKLIKHIKKMKITNKESEQISPNLIVADKLSRELLDKNMEILDIKQEINQLKSLIESQNNLESSIENLNLVIEHKSEKIIVTKENIVGAQMNMYVLRMKLNEIIIRKEMLEEEKKDINKKISEVNSETLSCELTSKVDFYFSEIGNIEIDENKIETYIEKRKKEKRESIREIKNGINNAKKEFWNILEPILKKMEISPEYIKESIILTDDLKGKTGMQYHKLTFSYKIALTLYFKAKYNIKLPFIIDSPGSGEASDDNGKIMIEICNELLEEHQIIVSSIHEYNTKFNFEKIIIDNGVVGELERFMGKNNNLFS